MAGLADILGRTVYLDTNIFIYAVEGYAPEEAFLRELFAALEDGRFTAVTSELSLAEVLVKPFELGREDVAAAIRRAPHGVRPLGRAAGATGPSWSRRRASARPWACACPTRSTWPRRSPPAASCS